MTNIDWRKHMRRNWLIGFVCAFLLISGMQVFTEDHAITITQDGTVGINNDAPDSSYALDVGGSIRIAGDLAVEGMRPLPRGYIDCDLTHMWDDIEPAVSYLECTVGPTAVLIEEETVPWGAAGITVDTWVLLTVSAEGVLQWSAANPSWDSGSREWRDGVDPDLRVIAGAYKDTEGKWIDKFIWLSRKEVYPTRETFGRYAVYTSDGTWVRPPYAVTAVVIALGGGGGGGGIADFFDENPGGRGGDSEFVEPGGVILVAGIGGEGGMYSDHDDDSPGGSGGGGQGIYVYPGEQGGTGSSNAGYGGAAGLPGSDALDLLQVVLNQSEVSPGSRKSPPTSGDGLAGNYYGGGGTGTVYHPPLGSPYGSGGGGGGGMGASVLDLIEFGTYTINVGSGGVKGDGLNDGGVGQPGFVIVCW
jgi:hypothetical protein